MEFISKELHEYAFKHDAKPVCTIEPGSEIVVETYDCYVNVLTTAGKKPPVKFERINPATGPIGVNGAEPGDTLKVTIRSIDLDPEGTMNIHANSGMLRSFVREPEVKKLKIEAGVAHLSEKYQVPVKPMIGVIGVSPAAGEISTVDPGHHGGNLDCKEITTGAIVYLPVFVTGANLALGDLHALMGDGEVAGCGVEIGGRVTLKVELIKGVHVGYPVVEDRDCFYLLASAKTIGEASDLATSEMFRFLCERMPEADINDVMCLVGMCGDIRISQLVNPLMTAKFAVPKAVFPVQF